MPVRVDFESLEYLETRFIAHEFVLASPERIDEKFFVYTRPYYRGLKIPLDKIETDDDDSYVVSARNRHSSRGATDEKNHARNEGKRKERRRRALGDNRREKREICMRRDRR